VNLGCGGGSHAVLTADIMKAFEPVVLQYKPQAVLVVGDVDSTLACALVAVKLGVKLAHVEAGLRSFDRAMPEEVNRVLTDAVSDLLFCTEQSGVDNLLREGVDRQKIFLVGNVMVDTLLANRARAEESGILEQLKISAGDYAVLTLHRPANVDDPVVLGRLLDALETIQRDMPVVFPIHPRTRKNLETSSLSRRVQDLGNLKIVDPMGYLDFLKLLSHARLALTDSGGLQEETTVLKVPCLTLRENTERPVTVAVGSNRIVGTDPQKILAAYREVLDGPSHPSGIPPLWDGQAAQRIVKILAERL
jgi:UDP-N-acetylglucosamine 2-epimerase (non-hydrolysing)